MKQESNILPRPKHIKFKNNSGYMQVQYSINLDGAYTIYINTLTQG